MVELRQHDTNLLHKAFAGDVFNTAVYLQRSSGNSLDVQFFSAVGTDSLSDQLKSYANTEHIGTDLLFRVEDANPGLYMIETDLQGERRFRYWRQASAARQVMQCYTAHGDDTLLTGCQLLYFSGISLAILSPADRQLLFLLLRKLKTHGCKLAFDANYRAGLWQYKEEAAAVCMQAYALADIALSGLDDHLALFGHQSAQQMSDWLLQLGIEEFVVKDGSRGSLGYCKQQAFYTLACSVKEVVDTTSAGDAFNGGYLAARLKGLNAEESALYASRLAAFVVSQPGAIVEPAVFADFTRLP
ncbi:2-dehydro-3-deoxygluconokinase [Alkalimonas amylolytica]|uniref:2-dehydro-3-deoxygluconokinase n=2 Tax=Alkalimonas amylolytica TaxID=152573 RepID=A0A1H4FLE2_ALKAM|nr:2-dehydro-3-deoxygluconokinase [Alkalimonas amylolytica]